MKKAPKISVLMPAYNSEAYIAEAIESILNQTFSDFEFLIINDGSTDKTADIVAQYAKVDKRIKFIDNKKNQGLIAVLNQGLDLARGEYIARMDSDDISMPERFEKQISYMDANPDVGMVGTAGQNFGADNTVNYSPEIVDVVELLRGVGFYHPSVMIRKSVLDEHNLRYDKDFYLVEDHELWTRMLKVTKLRNIPDVLLRYRVHSNSVSVTNSRLQETNKHIVRRKMLANISEVPHVQRALLDLANIDTQTKAPVYTYIFKRIPLLKTKYKSNDNIQVFLFNVLPLIKIKRNSVYLFHFIKIAKQKRHTEKRLTFNNFHAFKVSDAQLLAELGQLGEFTYIPNSGNLGDMLIAGATLGFFDFHNIKYKMFNGKSDKYIVYGGGGQWTADYEQYWLKWLDIFKAAKKVVILPSSFNECQKLIDILDERFVVFCREKQSFEYLKKAKTRAKVLLDHDMAFRITKDITKKPVRFSGWERYDAARKIVNAVPMTRDIAFLMRQDCESAGHYRTDLDLSTVRYGKADISPDDIMFCTQLMFIGVDCANTIVTDRLHVAIAAAVSGKEVYMLDNTYKKLSNVYKHSMADNPHVHFCTEMPKMQDLVSRPHDKPNFALLHNL